MMDRNNALCAENIRAKLSQEHDFLKIDVRETVSSTNTVLKGIAEQDGAEGEVLIARHQTAGKGRLGRSFFSPEESGLYMSVLLRPKLSAEDSLLITTAAAVAVSEAIDEVTGENSKIKWVNDIYLRGRKVCGILTEASINAESGGLNYAVLGIGVNITPPKGGFSEELSDIAGALFEENAPEGVSSQLAAEILDRFFKIYRNLPDNAFMSEYRARSLLTGVDITFVENGEEQEGKVLDIDEQARLIVLLPDGSKKLFGAGEVNIKKDFLEKLRSS